MQKQYHELIAGRIYFGGASDIQQIADVEHIDVVVDLREESTGCAASNPTLIWQQIPLGDNADQPQAPLFKDAIQAVVSAYRDGKKWLPLRRRQGPNRHSGRGRAVGARPVQHARRSRSSGQSNSPRHQYQA